MRAPLEARFETYLARRHSGEPAPCSARAAAERIGWQAHTVAKRCENIRNRYTRRGVPGLRGPRALEELAPLTYPYWHQAKTAETGCPPTT